MIQNANLQFRTSGTMNNQYRIKRLPENVTSRNYSSSTITNWQDTLLMVRMERAKYHGNRTPRSRVVRRRTIPRPPMQLLPNTTMTLTPAANLPNRQLKPQHAAPESNQARENALLVSRTYHSKTCQDFLADISTAMSAFGVFP